MLRVFNLNHPDTAAMPCVSFRVGITTNDNILFLVDNTFLEALLTFCMLAMKVVLKVDSELFFF